MHHGDLLTQGGWGLPWFGPSVNEDLFPLATTFQATFVFDSYDPDPSACQHEWTGKVKGQFTVVASPHERLDPDNVYVYTLKNFGPPKCFDAAYAQQHLDCSE
ncbi:unannotated protein [freshwater metagenome]|uniref:Unannotated protein n=1 Tax=freshwater metagenome TaxID=449393 RepID=A0A6J6XM11_9ZZZZ